MSAVIVRTWLNSNTAAAENVMNIFSILQGIRRVIALTGPEAAKARQKAKLLENRCEGVRGTVTEAKLPQKGGATQI